MLLPIPDDVLQAQARERMLDVLLGSLGLSVAVVSASFAAYMVVANPGGDTATGPSRVLLAQGAGVAHQAIRAMDAPPPPAIEPADAAADQALDFTPTGTISSTPPQRNSAVAPPGVVLPDFAVRDVFDGTALVEVRGTLQMVRPGSMIEGAGEVLSISRKGKGWVVVTAGGTIVQRR